MAPARRATANVDAPVWKSYVAARVEHGVGPAAKGALSLSGAMARTRKRAKPSGGDVLLSGIVPAAGGGFSAKQHCATRASLRTYWEALTVQERLQILMVDDPDIVKQLYKLNLSLLCVGLMQRHLKAGSTTRAAGAPPIKNPAATASQPGPSTAAAAVSSTNADTVPTSSSDSERTYDLLEAMEFMDIGTGILTVKTELVEDVDHMFALVTAVLHGFLATIHVLSESQFHDLFVTESEVINTWEDYERLIAMLVEQLMLRSYVAHLEKQALLQMEALLLEASLEDEGGGTAKGTLGSATACIAKKKKKKKKKAKTTKQMSSPNTVIEDHGRADAEADADLSEVEGEPEEENPSGLEAEDCTWQSECSTEDADLSGPSSPVKSLGKSMNRLNPHARAFQPIPISLSNEELTSPTSGKRKLDDFLIHIPWQDLMDGFNDDGDDDDYSDNPLEEVAGALGCRRPREKIRRREEDAELEWHLQHMYASTSALFGWDFNEQREIAALAADPWVDAGLWRTDPRDVVRYYFPPTAHPAAFGAAGFPPAQMPPPVESSRYYFTPPHAMPRPAPSTPSAATGTTAAAVPASLYTPFLPPSSGAPVSFWDENAAQASMYPEVLQSASFPRFRGSKSPRRRTKLASTSHSSGDLR